MIKDWDFAAWKTAGREDDCLVPGANLRYRLSGPESAPFVVVFENGWSGSFPYAVWLEQALASKVQVLCYDRAGVGDSQSLGPISAATMTQQLIALLNHLGLHKPVVIAGHSYGGLIAALHAAQAPSRVKAIIQIDNTPEFDDPVVDVSWRLMPRATRFLQLCALLGWNSPVVGDLGNELPKEIFERIKRTRSWLVKSLTGSLAEILLLDEIRATLAASGGARECPRLVITSTPEQKRGWLGKLFIADSKMQEFTNAVRSLHKRQAVLNTHSRWMTLPYTHVSLISNPTAAQTVADNLLDFIG